MGKLLLSLLWDDLRAAARTERGLQTKRRRRALHPVVVPIGTATQDGATNGIHFRFGLRLIDDLGLVSRFRERPVGQQRRANAVNAPPETSPAPRLRGLHQIGT